MALAKKLETYTYTDYCTWDDSKRWEIIDGHPYAMAPAPSPRHQGISGELFYKIRSLLDRKPCRVFAAPFDVRLNPHDGDDTVVQPDLVVICDPTKVDDKGCVGAPDMVIEISSPSTAKIDRTIKLHKYEEAGVREYWIVDPDSESVQVFIRKDGHYFVKGYADDAVIPVHVLPGCEIRLCDIFVE